MSYSQIEHLIKSVSDLYPELPRVYAATTGSSDHDTESKILWKYFHSLWKYYYYSQNDYPDFTEIVTQMCIGSGQVCAVDAKHRISSEWHALYVQRAVVLHWVVFMHCNDPACITPEQMSIFDAHIKELETFIIPGKSNHSSLTDDEQKQVCDAFQKLRQCGSASSEPECTKAEPTCKRTFDVANKTENMKPQRQKRRRSARIQNLKTKQQQQQEGEYRYLANEFAF